MDSEGGGRGKGGMDSEGGGRGEMQKEGYKQETIMKEVDRDK